MSRCDPAMRPSEYGGDGRSERTALQEAYRPDGDREGASMEGLLSRRQQEEKRRADDH